MSQLRQSIHREPQLQKANPAWGIIWDGAGNKAEHLHSCVNPLHLKHVMQFGSLPPHTPSYGRSKAQINLKNYCKNWQQSLPRPSKYVDVLSRSSSPAPMGTGENICSWLLAALKPLPWPEAPPSAVCHNVKCLQTENHTQKKKGGSLHRAFWCYITRVNQPLKWFKAWS